MAGAVLEFLPYRSFRLISHLNLIHIEFLVAGLLMLVRMHNKSSRRSAAGFGLVIGLTYLTDLTYTTFLVLAATAFALVHARTTFTRAGLERWGVAASVGLIVSLPLLIPMIADVVHHEAPVAHGSGGADYYSADLFSWITPNADDPLLGSDSRWLSDTVTGSEHTAYTGVIVVALGVVGALLHDKRRRVWLSIVGLFGLLALGPYLHVWGHTGRAPGSGSIPLPYHVLQKLPVFNSSRSPGRFGVMASIGLVMLACIALDALRRRRPRVGLVVLVLYAVVTLVEFSPRSQWVLQASAVPAPYAAMKESSKSGAVLDIPLQWRDGFRFYGDTVANRDDTVFIYAASIDRAAVGGTVSRMTSPRLALLQRKKVYRDILILQGDLPAPSGWKPSFGREDLRTLGISFVIYHAERPMPNVLAYIERLGLKKFATDGVVTTWQA